MSSMTISILLLLIGSALIWAGWTDRPLRKVLSGDASR